MIFADKSPTAALAAQRAAGPLPLEQRLTALDTLRGVALLGILPMNIQAFSMIGAAYLNPTAYGDLHGANYWVWFISHLLAEQKFITVFSMLFGAGIALMALRLEGSGINPARIHYRRMLWLIVFGLMHAFLLWYGDVLLTYGLCGLLAFSFRKLPPARLILVGLGFVTVASVICVWFAWSIPHWSAERLQTFTQGVWQPTPAMIQSELAAYRSSWLGEMHQRFHDAMVLQVEGFVLLIFWRVEGLMLIGMALLKLEVMTGRRPAKIYWMFIAMALMIGLPTILYGTSRDFATGWNLRRSLFMDYQCNYWASILVSLGWIGIVILVSRLRTMRRIINLISSLGRMAFTNYILDTLICTTLFYGFGMGLYGKVSRTTQIEVVLLIWIAQLWLSSAWLRYFRFGPLEWLWRSLTYRRLQPLRQAEALKFAAS